MLRFWMKNSLINDVSETWLPDSYFLSRLTRFHLDFSELPLIAVITPLDGLSWLEEFYMHINSHLRVILPAAIDVLYFIIDLHHLDCPSPFLGIILIAASGHRLEFTWPSSIPTHWAPDWCSDPPSNWDPFSRRSPPPLYFSSAHFMENNCRYLTPLRSPHCGWPSTPWSLYCVVHFRISYDPIVCLFAVTCGPINSIFSLICEKFTLLYRKQLSPELFSFRITTMMNNVWYRKNDNHYFVNVSHFYVNVYEFLLTIILECVRKHFISTFTVRITTDWP